MAPASTPTGILVSEPVARSDGARLLEAGRQAGFDAVLVVDRPGETPSAGSLALIRFALLSVDVIGLSSKTLAGPELASFVDTLRAAPDLRWLQVPSAGMDRPFYAELRERGTRLSSAAGANAKAVAQTALAGLLALSRGVPLWIDAQRARRWRPLRGELTPEQLDGQRAVVFGMGPIGLDIGRLLAALDLHVTGVRRTPAPAPGFERVVAYGDHAQAVAAADWVVLACPLTDETRRLVDAPFLARMRRGARLVNVARGEVVDEAALVDALRGGSLAGAYLDVFENEPLPAGSPLWDLPGVLVSAHSAGNSTGHQRGVIDLFCRNLQRIAADRPLINEWRADARARTNPDAP